jgi:hypothetical protein
MKAAAQQMTENLDSRQLLRFLTDFKKGDFSVRLPFEQDGVAGKICDTLNDIIEQNQRMTLEFERISKREGSVSRRKATCDAIIVRVRCLPFTVTAAPLNPKTSSIKH